MHIARTIVGFGTLLVLAAGCGPSGDGSSTHTVDVVTLGIDAWKAEFRGDAPGVSILAAGVDSETRVTLQSTPPAVYTNFRLALPPGAVGAHVAGTVNLIASLDGTGTTMVCAGPVAVDVTSHGTSSGTQVVGSLASASIPCTVPAGTAITVSAAFSATR